ncbi:MAG: hypothetical protein K2Y29_09130, partial [Beijerinckiaceae bacterium]|nr:hypothetical protein [Beijerinckiaceae bacterium]
MRTLLRSGAMTLAAALISTSALVSAPAMAASEPFKVAQAGERDRDRGDKGDRGDLGGDRAPRGGAEMRGAGPRGGAEMRGPQMQRGDNGPSVQRSQRIDRMDRAPTR